MTGDLAGVVGGLVQLGRRGVHGVVRPDEVEDLLAVEPSLGSEGEELDERGGLLPRPRPCGHQLSGHGDIETTEQLHAYRCHDPTPPSPPAGTLTTSCTGTIVAYARCAGARGRTGEGPVRTVVSSEPPPREPTMMPLIHPQRWSLDTGDPTAELGTVLGVWAHPDDEAYLSAGLMALARRHGRPGGRRHGDRRRARHRRPGLLATGPTGPPPPQGDGGQPGRHRRATSTIGSGTATARARMPTRARPSPRSARSSTPSSPTRSSPSGPTA